MSPEEVKSGAEIIKIGNEWMKLLLGPLVKQIGLSWGDIAEERRLRRKANLESAGRKIQTILLDSEIAPKQLSDKLSETFIEGMSLEEDDTLRELWANMFVNYVDTERNLNVVVYPGILKQLSSSEVRILSYMGSEKRPRLWRYADGDGPCPYTDEEVNNLIRLSLVEEIVEQTQNTQKDGAGMINPFIKTKRTGKYVLTEFGDDFLDACRRIVPTVLEKRRRRSNWR
jgi:hypothetical protein